MTDETRMEAPSLFLMMYTYVAPRDAVSTPMPRTATIRHFTKLGPVLYSLCKWISENLPFYELR